MGISFEYYYISGTERMVKDNIWAEIWMSRIKPWKDLGKSTPGKGKSQYEYLGGKQVVIFEAWQEAFGELAEEWHVLLYHFSYSVENIL